LPSRSIKVQPSSQLFKELAKLDIQFKLNWSDIKKALIERFFYVIINVVELMLL
jgi:hypothetical protein